MAEKKKEIENEIVEKFRQRQKVELRTSVDAFCDLIKKVKGVKPILRFSQSGSKARFRIEGMPENILAFKEDLEKIEGIGVEIEDKDPDDTICRREKPPPKVAFFCIVYIFTLRQDAGACSSVRRSALSEPEFARASRRAQCHTRGLAPASLT